MGIKKSWKTERKVRVNQDHKSSVESQSGFVSKCRRLTSSQFCHFTAFPFCHFTVFLHFIVLQFSFEHCKSINLWQVAAWMFQWNCFRSCCRLKFLFSSQKFLSPVISGLISSSRAHSSVMQNLFAFSAKTRMITHLVLALILLEHLQNSTVSEM